ncbi:hypothetical protein SAMN05443428_10327 [Caloramator quimbayensis]|uniref:Uncharacterized protein n=1 Tax=Caloramator quimbayensis TaxID=1147123 RepID=A0A1T4WPJ0_9CLOT|nr:hypothetical protein [Caloramator quimbayensis]SKA79274.1 hypothetical protein SAMN05443428_10327 [Caloramator quimbayensis]
MMKKVYLQEWILKIDAEKTKEYYDSITVEEGCGCDYCRNYIKNCKTFSKEVMDFYTMLGIDPEKEGEFMEFEANAGKHLYMGFYHLIGEIVKRPNNGADKWDNANIIKIGNVKFTFTDKLDLVPDNLPKPVMQLEFEVMLPWIL